MGRPRLGPAGFWRPAGEFAWIGHLQEQGGGGGGGGGAAWVSRVGSLPVESRAQLALGSPTRLRTHPPPTPPRRHAPTPPRSHARPPPPVYPPPLGSEPCCSEPLGLELLGLVSNRPLRLDPRCPQAIDELIDVSLNEDDSFKIIRFANHLRLVLRQPEPDTLQLATRTLGPLQLL